MNIIFSVLGEGFGHASRCSAIAKELEKRGHECLLLCYGPAKRYLESIGHCTQEVGPEWGVVYKGGRIDMFGVLMSMQFGEAKKLYMGQKKIFKSFGADLLVNDFFYSSMGLSRKMRIPCFIMTNQTRFLPHFPLALKPAGAVLQLQTYEILKKADRVIIPDFPPPNTICKHSITRPSKNVIFTNPIVRSHPKKSRKGKSILSVIGGFEHRIAIQEELIRIADNLPERNFFIVAGHFGQKLHAKSKNVRIMQLTLDLYRYMEGAELVVSHAGLTTISECIAFNRPVIVFPDLKQQEQIGIARRVEELGIGKWLGYDKLDELKNHIEEILEGGYDKAKLAYLSKLLNRKRGEVKVADEIETFVRG